MYYASNVKEIWDQYKKTLCISVFRNSEILHPIVKTAVGWLLLKLILEKACVEFLNVVYIDPMNTVFE